MYQINVWKLIEINEPYSFVERIQRLVDSSAKASKYYSSSYFSYAEICYEVIHTSLKNKSGKDKSRKPKI